MTLILCSFIGMSAVFIFAEARGPRTCSHWITALHNHVSSIRATIYVTHLERQKMNIRVSASEPRESDERHDFKDTHSLLFTYRVPFHRVGTS
jgi:hypothetical protein